MKTFDDYINEATPSDYWNSPVQPDRLPNGMPVPPPPPQTNKKVMRVEDLQQSLFILRPQNFYDTSGMPHVGVVQNIMRTDGSGKEFRITIITKNKAKETFLLRVM